MGGLDPESLLIEDGRKTGEWIDLSLTLWSLRTRLFAWEMSHIAVTLQFARPSMYIAFDRNDNSCQPHELGE